MDKFLFLPCTPIPIVFGIGLDNTSLFPVFAGKTTIFIQSFSSSSGFFSVKIERSFRFAVTFSRFTAAFAFPVRSRPLVAAPRPSSDRHVLVRFPTECRTSPFILEPILFALFQYGKQFSVSTISPPSKELFSAIQKFSVADPLGNSILLLFECIESRFSGGDISVGRCDFLLTGESFHVPCFRARDSLQFLR